MADRIGPCIFLVRVLKQKEWRTDAVVASNGQPPQRSEMPRLGSRRNAATFFFQGVFFFFF